MMKFENVQMMNQIGMDCRDMLYEPGFKTVGGFLVKLRGIIWYSSNRMKGQIPFG
jgi:hypothetical protein